MRHRSLASLGVLAVVAIVLTWAAVSIAGQTRGQTTPSAPRPAAATPAAQTRGQTTTAAPKPAAKPYTGPRTPWGEPDLQGTWFVTESVPLERSAQNANKPMLTEAEVAELDKAKSANIGRNAREATAA